MEREREMTTDGKEAIEREVEETLRCLDEVETIQAAPFFYTRLMAGIGESSPQPAANGALSLLRPVFLALLVALNAFSVAWFFQAGDYQPETREDSIEAFASAYSLYDDDNGA